MSGHIQDSAYSMLSAQRETLKTCNILEDHFIQSFLASNLVVDDFQLATRRMYINESI